MLVAAAIATCGSGLGLVHTVPNLQHGIGETPEHWWSTINAAVFTCSLFASIVLGVAKRTAALWSLRR